MANDFPTQSRPDTKGNPSVLLVFRNQAKTQEGATATANSVQPTGNLVPANGLSDALDTAVRSGPIVDLPGGVYEYDIALGKSVPVDTGVIVKHNIRRPVRLALYTGPPATNAPVWDSGPIDPIVRAELTEAPSFQEWDFNGGPLERVLANQAARYQLITPIYAPEEFYVTHARFSVDGSAGNNLALQWGDPAEGSDFFQAAYFMLATRFRPVVNMSLGWNMGGEDAATTQRLEAQALVGRERGWLRGFTMPLAFLSAAEGFNDVYGDLLEGERSLGRVFVVQQPHRPSRFHRQAFIGTVTSQSGVEEFAHELTEATITFTETE